MRLHDEERSRHVPPDQLPLLPQFRARAPLPAHQVPHPQRPVLTDAEGHLARGMDGHGIHWAFVAFERAKDGPVPRTEEGEGAVFGGGEEVRTGGKGKVRNRACESPYTFSTG